MTNRSNFIVQIFANNLLETYEHYKRAFGATILFSARGSKDELIHLEIDIMGNKIAIAPLRLCDIVKGNITVLCLKFQHEETLKSALNVLKEDGKTEGLKSYPWSKLEGYVTDKFGVNWCIGI